MTEAELASRPELLGIPSQSPILPRFELPFHLRRDVLRRIQHEENTLLTALWNERGKRVEDRVKLILETQNHLIKEVEKNKANTKQSDLTVRFFNDLDIEPIRVEVKSSSLGISNYKQNIKESLPDGEKDDEHVKLWMTTNRIILINGGEAYGKEKTPEEILNDSFYPQLERIITHKIKEVQIFPAA